MNQRQPPEAHGDSPLHRPAPHESALLHATGAATYVDDLPDPPALLHAAVVASPAARGVIRGIHATDAFAVPGVVGAWFASDIPGEGTIGPIVHDEPLLADGEVHAVGQAVAVVAAETHDAARRGAARVRLDIDPLHPIVGIDAAIAAGSFHTAPHVIARGDVDAALAGAALRLSGEVRSGAQDHFYLETQCALVEPVEHGGYRVRSSTQHPTEIQRMVARVLGIAEHLVSVEVPRLGGGFGGKESQATQVACLAALVAHRTGRPCKLRLERDEDALLTGRRHPFLARWEAGFDDQGRLLGLRADLYSDGGWTVDLSGPVLDRALFHVENTSYVPAVRLAGRVCRTNTASNTAFRGFGGPQGMLVIADALNAAAEVLGLDPAEIRRRNAYGDAPRDRTPYDQVVAHNRLPRIFDELLDSSDYAARRAAIDDFNAGGGRTRRGIGLQTVKFGISFTKSLLNQAGALVLVYADGTVQCNHGGVEMGQGLHTKIQAVCADALGIARDRVRVMPTSTEKVPNTSATAASSGSDLNGEAVRRACAVLVERMAPVRDLLRRELDREPTFAEVATRCWLERISLAATGFYATPGIAYDPEVGQGTPFHYFAFGGAVVEIEVCGWTGGYRLRRVDILHDVGNSLVPTIDRGQVEGAFVQGFGWLTMEEALFDDGGRPITLGPSTYKVPALGDVPEDFRVTLLDRADQPGVVGGSKAVGEPPFMLAIGALTALRHAIGSFGPRRPVPLAIPATPEAVLRAIHAVRDG